MKKEISSSDYNDPRTLIYVSCLPSDTTEQKIHEILSKWIKIKSINISRSRTPPYHCKGFAVVESDSPNQAKNLISKKQIKVGDAYIKLGEFYDDDIASELASELKSRRIFIKKLPQSCTDQALYQFFLKYGPIERAYCVQKKKKNFKFGYVIFKNQDSIFDIPKENLIFKNGFKLNWRTTARKSTPEPQKTPRENDKKKRTHQNKKSSSSEGETKQKKSGQNARTIPFNNNKKSSSFPSFGNESSKIGNYEDDIIHNPYQISRPGNRPETPFRQHWNFGPIGYDRNTFFNQNQNFASGNIFQDSQNQGLQGRKKNSDLDFLKI